MSDAIGTLVILFVVVWVPLLAALVWGKCPIPADEVSALGRRAARISSVIGFPLMLCGLVLFAHLDPAHVPLGEMVGPSVIMALALLPFYGAMIATNVFQERHKRGREKGEAHPFMIRLVSGTAILGTNLVAVWLVFLALIGSSGIFRKMHSWGW